MRLWRRRREVQRGPVPLNRVMKQALEQNLREFVATSCPFALVISPFSVLPRGAALATLRVMASSESTAPTVVFLPRASQPQSIGRASNCAAHVRSPSVSRIHALICTEPEVRLMDAGSSFGTTVNDARLEPNQYVPLQPGDQLCFGETHAAFETSASLFEFLRAFGRAA